MIVIKTSFTFFLYDLQKQKTEQLRMWPFVMRPNKTYRPAYFDQESVLLKKLSEVVVTNDPCNIFVETLRADCESDSWLPNFQSENQVLIFCKLYDAKVRKIRYMRSMRFPRRWPVREYNQGASKER